MYSSSSYITPRLTSEHVARSCYYKHKSAETPQFTQVLFHWNKELFNVENSEMASMMNMSTLHKGILLSLLVDVLHFVMHLVKGIKDLKQVILSNV